MRRFASIGLIATAVDIGVLLLLARGVGLIVVAADAVALVVAAGVSFGLHRQITFAGDPAVRWVQHPLAFVLGATVAGAVDVVVLRAVVELTGWESAATLATAKVPAIAAASGVRFVAYRWVLFGAVRAELAERQDRPPAPGDRRLSVVIPAYHEADRITATVARVRAELADVAPGAELEVVVVDDGSGDGTGDAAVAAGADQVLTLPANRGKGAAVRAGVLAAHGRTIAFTDADLSYPPAQLADLLAEVEAGWDVVVGSRVHTQTSTLVRARRVRELGGRAINLCTHAVLLGAHRDTQCGIKAFRSDVARSLFSRTRIDGFAFDVEVFHLAERDQLSVREVPVRVANAERSSVRVVRDGLALIRDLVRIVRGGRAGWYDQDPEGSTASTGAEPGTR
ncbi:glycosyltransferase [Iamia sp.]|uniref:glycosyltransferase n=1 Tax=Iamia sp. TaxID=2722710 RepID=UPI002CCE8C92|nr:glycosyltransferase [Iamia sp.]HXH58214.1 glycosyltransferase [Iamia sp.]